MRLNLETDEAAETDFAVASDSSHSSVDYARKFRAGVKAVHEGDREGARRLLLEAAETEPNSEEVWLRLASVSEYPEELLVFLNNALRINPTNGNARQWAQATETLISKSFAACRASEPATSNDVADAKENTRWKRVLSFNSNEETAETHAETFHKHQTFDEENLLVGDGQNKIGSSGAREAIEREMSKIVCCPFCGCENEPQAFVCPSCLAVLTLSDLEMLLAHADADREIVRQAVERMEAEKDFGDFGVGELKVLGIGQINLKNLRGGFSYLREAAQADPNDVVLSSQVNALAIRLSEIEAQESIHSSTAKNKTILVVDDSETVRKLISGKLEKAGHVVLCAFDGMDALEKIEENAPDLILLDITMPRMDGYQVCKMIRTNEKTKDIPIVMISGKDGFFDKVRGRMAGTTGYITKPFGPETLMKTVENYIV